MKRVKFNVNRKIMYSILCIMMILVFSLTLAYAVLSTTLNISGNSEVIASNWNIYLNNPRVTTGSVNSSIPTINGNVLNFSAVLTTPGDFYEFTVDVVNDGSIDAVIENVVKSPELTTAQAKYLNYEISYQNGESVSAKQTLRAGSTMPIKVRVEFRKDIIASDLPSSENSLNLKLTLIYIQSDGNGTLVENDGNQIVFINGSLDDVGTIVKIGSEEFYVIGSEDNNIKLFSKYNLDVGGVYENDFWSANDVEDMSGMQSSFLLGYSQVNSVHFGTTPFADSNYCNGYCSNYSGSVVENYVLNYKTKVEEFGIDVRIARLILDSELTDKETFNCEYLVGCSSKFSWIYSTSYWTGTATNDTNLWAVTRDNTYDDNIYSSYRFGVRPVLIISRNELLGLESELISFTIDGVTYQAEDGMDWYDWVASDYNVDNYDIVLGADEYIAKNGDYPGECVCYSDGSLVFDVFDLITENYNYGLVYEDSDHLGADGI